nr:hypothetical protein [Planosporangium flavigriseum]
MARVPGAGLRDGGCGHPAHTCRAGAAVQGRRRGRSVTGEVLDAYAESPIFGGGRRVGSVRSVW